VKVNDKIIITIPASSVRQIDNSVEFHKDKFGFDCSHKVETFGILVRDDIELHLCAACNNFWKWKSIILFLKPIRSGAESFLAVTHSCRIEVKGIDELYEELKEKMCYRTKRQKLKRPITIQENLQLWIFLEV
jgi:hypothetical protein